MSSGINIWGGRNTNLLSMRGKAIGEDNRSIANAVMCRMEKMYRENYFSYRIGGLSACQVAENEDEVLQLILLNDVGIINFYANPKIIKMSTFKVIARIACYSAANGERALQASPQWFEIQYLDLDTWTVKETRLNYPVTNSAWHEMTHLRGASYEEDVLPGTRVLTGDELTALNAYTDEEKFLALLGGHPLAMIYDGSEVLYSAIEVENFILGNCNLTLNKSKERLI